MRRALLNKYKPSNVYLADVAGIKCQFPNMIKIHHFRDIADKKGLTDHMFILIEKKNIRVGDIIKINKSKLYEYEKTYYMKDKNKDYSIEVIDYDILYNKRERKKEKKKKKKKEKEYMEKLNKLCGGYL